MTYAHGRVMNPLQAANEANAAYAWFANLQARIARIGGGKPGTVALIFKPVSKVKPKRKGKGDQ